MRHRRGSTLGVCLGGLAGLAFAVPAALSVATACRIAGSPSTNQVACCSWLANSAIEFAQQLPTGDPRSTGPANCSDLSSLDGWSFSPPVDAAGHAIPGMNFWEQRYRVRPAGDGYVLTVDIRYAGGTIHSASRTIALAPGNP